MENKRCVQNNDYFLEKANSLFPKLYKTEVFPLENPRGLPKNEIFAKTDAAEPLGTGESLLLDFGDHQVGYLRMKLGFTGSHPDAPVWLRVRFAERLQELKEDVNAYHGWISKGWIQSEELHIDILPMTIDLPRRYAFRYVLIEILDVSSKFQLTVDEVSCTAVSSADDGRLQPFDNGSPEDAALDRIACRTLHECMQTVFEDGPKRDRRLWIGDLRLQALTNYETYRQNDMVKSCLYLFAGSTLAEGRVSACIFLEPEIEADDTVMFDYSLFFIAALRDYYTAAGDLETVCELYPTALRQWELAQENFDENGVIRDSDVLGWCFVDWDLYLNKQASAQGIYLYCTRALLKLTQVLEGNIQMGAAKKSSLLQSSLAETLETGEMSESGETSEPDETAEKRNAGKRNTKDVDYTSLSAELSKDLKQKTDAATVHFYDQELGVFVSGDSRQVSYASQAWMVLGGAADGSVLEKVGQIPGAHKMVTPYMYHHFADALIQAGKTEKAMELLRRYWGGMAAESADTFWELYNPENPLESPYGGSIVNSYCHAWSCGPAYFLRKYALEK
ncbi:MAG: cellobiose phosphorylase [Lachnospiraceae bacterium]|nr:cellobiose phosphorylase [Lachnospiraceae bacterium]